MLLASGLEFEAESQPDCQRSAAVVACGSSLVERQATQIGMGAIV